MKRERSAQAVLAGILLLLAPQTMDAVFSLQSMDITWLELLGLVCDLVIALALFLGQKSPLLAIGLAASAALDGLLIADELTHFAQFSFAFTELVDVLLPLGVYLFLKLTLAVQILLGQPKKSGGRYLLAALPLVCLAVQVGMLGYYSWIAEEVVRNINNLTQEIMDGGFDPNVISGIMGGLVPEGQRKDLTLEILTFWGDRYRADIVAYGLIAGYVFREEGRKTRIASWVATALCLLACWGYQAAEILDKLFAVFSMAPRPADDPMDLHKWAVLGAVAALLALAACMGKKKKAPASMQPPQGQGSQIPASPYGEDGGVYVPVDFGGPAPWESGQTQRLEQNQE